MKLKFLGFPHTTSFASASVMRWFAGESRTIDDATGKALVKEYPNAFQVLKPAVKKAAKTAVIASGDGVDTSVLDQSVADLAEALETGDHDADLYLLREAELQGKTRKGAIAAIEARIEEVSG